ncbi:hypothetical protein PHET_00450 [Paragonimus heterotremus]|uniref:Ankyrin repeat and fibronectin type-III domain-containing protein 1 n=1 Tax=Paragonimus heterotremus TaxID=100268 RepID=A0A8J4WVA2_9TREM|nr:hypothetical protein PHET_00450 [Paragonimus heterotremus]
MPVFDTSVTKLDPEACVLEDEGNLCQTPTQKSPDVNSGCKPSSLEETVETKAVKPMGESFVDSQDQNPNVRETLMQGYDEHKTESCYFSQLSASSDKPAKARKCLAENNVDWHKIGSLSSLSYLQNTDIFHEEKVEECSKTWTETSRLNQAAFSSFSKKFKDISDGESREALQSPSSQRTHVGQIHVRSVNRTKLQRSKSSAQITRAQQRKEVSTDKIHFDRSNSNQRGSSAEVNPDVELDSVKSHQRRPKSRRKTWIDKGRRSRSVNSFRKSASPRLTDQSVIFTLLTDIANHGTSEKYFRIRAPDHTCSPKTVRQNLTDLDEFPSLQVNKRSASQHVSQLPAESFPNPTSIYSTSAAHSKLNRYAVVRRLRRNNSTINFSVDRPLLKSDIGFISPTSQTAGDLLLPSKTLHSTDVDQGYVPDLMSDTLAKLFTYIEQDNLTELLLEADKIRLLSEQLQLNRYYECNEIGLSPLEVATLRASPPIILFLLAMEYQPGPVLRSALILGPNDSQIRDPMRFHLMRRIGNLEMQIVNKQTEFKSLIARANELSVTTTSQRCVPPESDLADMQSTAFLKVAEKERELSECIRCQENLFKMFRGLSRFPSVCRPPKKVTVMVLSSTSLLIRISPPDLVQDEQTSVLQDNGRNSSPIPTDVSSGASSEDEIMDLINTGRKFQNTNLKSQQNLVLRYRIEWSTRSQFKDSETSFCIVDPPVRIQTILQAIPTSNVAENRKTGNYFRTGFYELTELHCGQNIYVRVYSMSIRGWSKPCYSQPSKLSPSSWYEATNKMQENADTELSQLCSLKTTSPIRYVSNAVNDELHALKRLLDQQLFLWMYSQTGSVPDPGSVTSASVDESNKRTRSPMLQRKRSFRFPFASKGLKFVRQTKSGIYLAMLCHTNIQVMDESGLWKHEKQIVTIDDTLPMLCVTRDDSDSTFISDLNWFAKLVADPTIGPNLQLISENIIRIPTPANIRLRLRLLTALHQMQMSLGTYDAGSLYPEVFRGKLTLSGLKMPNENQDGLQQTNELFDSGTSVVTGTAETATESQLATIVVLVKHVQNPNELSFTGGLKWSTLQKFRRVNKLKPENVRLIGSELEPMRKSSVEEQEKAQLPTQTRAEAMKSTPLMNLITRLDDLLNYSEFQSQRLQPGLYVCFVQMKASMEQQASILIHESLPNPCMLPVELVRRRAHVSRAEWAVVCQLEHDNSQFSKVSPTTDERDFRFCKKLNNAINRLAIQLSLTTDEIDRLRIYLPEVVQISSEHSFILLFPTADQVCIPPGSNYTPPSDCSWYSMRFFERNLGFTYDSTFQRHMAGLISLLELLLSLATYVQRQCLTDPEWTQCSERTTALQSIQQQAESLFLGKRWLSECIATVRNRKRPQSATLTVERFRKFVELNVPQKLKEHYRTQFYCAKSSNELNLMRNTMDSSSTEEKNLYLDDLISYSMHGFTEEQQRQFPDSVPDSKLRTRRIAQSLPSSRGHGQKINLLRVYVEYPTGLTSGTCVRILASLMTTAEDIIHLVHEKVTDIVEKKFCQHTFTSKTKCSEDITMPTTNDLCLTVSVGDAERSLSNTIRPLLLQLPWRAGRFSVRIVQNQCSSASRFSPVRTYLVAEQLKTSLSDEQIPCIQPVLLPIRSSRARITEVMVSLNRATITYPPLIYINGFETDVIQFS